MLLAAACLAAGCAFGPGTQDWVFDGLPGNYSLWRTNSRSVLICRGKSKTGGEEAVPAYVTELFYNETHIFAKQAAVLEDQNEKIDSSDPNYYIIAVKEESVSGPMSEESFLKATRALLIEEYPWVASERFAQQAN